MTRSPRYLLLSVMLAVAPVVQAHDTGHPDPHVKYQPEFTTEIEYGLQHLLNSLLTPAVAAQVVISEENGYRVIRSDGLPEHATGRFPNRDNPNRISRQNHNYRIPLQPRLASAITPLGLWPFGIAINGIPFDPGAAEFWNNDRRSGWQYEALSGAVPLGVDDNNAHVQPNGTYHYHGLPSGLLARYAGQNKPVLIGYAADGFPIYGPLGYRKANDMTSALQNLRSSFRLKPGRRPGGPGGRYDGSFVQDYEYTAGRGDLDECNGRRGTTAEYPRGTYYYVITADFPYIPRCFKGTPDRSFIRRPRDERGSDMGSSRPGPGGPAGRRGPPQEAIDACAGRRQGDRVSFRSPRGDTIHATCQRQGDQLFAIPRF